MSTRTERKTLRLRDGRRLWVDVTETPMLVFLTFGGDQPQDGEDRRLARFLWPIVSRYEDDLRPIEFDGAHNRGGAKRLYTLAQTQDATLLAVTDVPRPRANA